MLDAHIQRFYSVLRRQASRHTYQLCKCNGRMPWPTRGVYFFFEDGELRKDSAARVVRVGTHAISANSQTTLWKRLSQHRGTTSSGGGNHRGSVFRLHVGRALLARDCASLPSITSWAIDPKPIAADACAAELAVERAVSAHIGNMPFTFIAINDQPGTASLRATIERNSIALLSAARAAGKEGPSSTWLGHSCPHPTIQTTGLWNVNHTDGHYDPAFLDTLDLLVLKS